MANRKLKKCPVNAALAAMRRKDPEFEIKEFLYHTGVSREDLFYHKKHPDARWINTVSRDRMEDFFKLRFNGKVIADHGCMRMIRVKKS